MKTRLLTIVATLSFLALCAGCATLLAPKTHPLSLASEPAGAQVYVNGTLMGSTPVQLELKADKTYAIEFRKEGFDTQTHIVNSKVGGGWIILDVMFGLVPVVIDAATGAWNKLDQTAIEAQLFKQN